MTKRIFNLALASVLSCGIAFGSENYTTEGKEKITRNGVNIFLETNSPNKDKIIRGDFDKALEALKNGYEKNLKTQPKASAPLVTQALILYVCSSKVNNQCEEIQDGQTQTQYDHDGSFFEVITAVEGYGGGSYDKAKFAGNTATQLYSDGVDLNGDNIVDGFIDYWDISKPANTNGTFEFTATSINNPAVSKSASIYIK
ncbi:DUF4879 domain-containing protein [Helicobacter sp. MIT 05-5294]|uniref:DUF4879 domain-containing protein n=1 Tax=Helicobacter sp. MIT 05-5294 TaxID=1548150 RepID=UPI0010FE4B0F|nr:DUF4879 domain-containing protein [Helicobacter sp. MIT 05-5294]TLD86563.1 DUF4879 domain-containing protein [Helicobacter sp. MIT 05-5294]